MSDFSNCTSSVVWPEIYHFSPLFFSLPSVCGRNSVLLRTFFFFKEKKLFFPPLPFSSHPSHSSILYATETDTFEAGQRHFFSHSLSPSAWVSSFSPPKPLSLLARISALRARNCLVCEQRLVLFVVGPLTLSEYT